MDLPGDPMEIIRTVFAFAPNLINASGSHAQTDRWVVYSQELFLVIIRVELDRLTGPVVFFFLKKWLLFPQAGYLPGINGPN